jgi:hypothetical protein
MPSEQSEKIINQTVEYVKLTIREKIKCSWWKIDFGDLINIQ